MRNSLLEEIGNGLARKPFERVSSRWGPKWGVFISAYPPLTVDNPLWRREESSLASLRLFGLSPDELQAEIVRYWQQAFWKRWLLGLLTPIHRKIKLLSYYHRCLSFREIAIKNLFDAKEPIAVVFKQYLGREVLNKLNRSRIQLENYVDKRAGNLKWIQSNKFFLEKYIYINRRAFLKLMKKKLTQLPIESDRSRLQSQLEKEYYRLQLILYGYFFNWRKNVFNRKDERINIPSGDRFVYNNASIEKELNFTVGSIEGWVKMKQKKLASTLQEESPGRFLKIKSLLESYLATLSLFVECQIVRYEKLIDKVRYDQRNGNEAIRQANLLQTETLYFLKKSTLLFHPDKSLGNKKLQVIQLELFKVFKPLSEESQKKIKENLQRLKIYLPKQRNTQEFWTMEQDFDLQVAKLKQSIEALDAKIKEVRAAIEADLKQSRIEIEAMKVKIDEYVKSQACSKIMHKQSLNRLIQEENETERGAFYSP